MVRKPNMLTENHYKELKAFMTRIRIPCKIEVDTTEHMTDEFASKMGIKFTAEYNHELLYEAIASVIHDARYADFAYEKVSRYYDLMKEYSDKVEKLEARNKELETSHEKMRILAQWKGDLEAYAEEKVSE